MTMRNPQLLRNSFAKMYERMAEEAASLDDETVLRLDELLEQQLGVGLQELSTASQHGALGALSAEDIAAALLASGTAVLDRREEIPKEPLLS
jgi:hypothetical protein